MTKTEPRAAAAEAVSVRVLPQGDGRIFTGETDDRTAARFPTYRRGEVFAVELDLAVELEARGLVEIQP